MSLRKMLSTVFLAALAATAPGFAEDAKTDETAADNPVVEVKTSRGTFEITLFRDKAPISVDNFLQYAKDGHYDGTVFHRVMAGFMIQGGGFTADLEQKPTRDPIKNEAKNGLKNTTGTVAMARLPQPDSATAQFFINVKDNAFLDHGERDFGYAVFGEITSGMDVVRKIENVKVGNARAANGMPLQNVPVEPVVIESVRLK